MSSTAKKRSGHADDCLAGLLRRPLNEAMKTKLKLMHAVCGEIVLNGKRLTIKGVVRKYESKRTEREPELAESTVRNKRGGRNPYIELYGAWELVAVQMQEDDNKVRKVHANSEIVSLAEVLTIEDLSLRHRTAQMVTRHAGLQHELNILKSEFGKHKIIVISPTPDDDGEASSGSRGLNLTSHETEALRAFIDKMVQGPLKKLADDGVGIVNGPRVADAGFCSAIDKILNAAGRGRR